MSDRINAASLNAVADAIIPSAPQTDFDREMERLRAERLRQRIRDEAREQQEHELQARKAKEIPFPRSYPIISDSTTMAAPGNTFRAELEKLDRAASRGRVTMGRVRGASEEPAYPEPTATTISDRLSMLVKIMHDLGDAADRVKTSVSSQTTTVPPPAPQGMRDNVTIFERYDIALDEIDRLTSQIAADLSATRAALGV